ncbi:MAG TPA: enolase C-terminal domain-like protein [Myxococcales bacterium]
MALEIEPYRLRLRTPFRSALGVVHARDGFVVRLHEDGLVGVGEACIVPELGTESFEECRMHLALPEPRTPSARHALSLARLDLQAQREGAPLAKLLDPDALAQVQVSAILSSPAEAASAVRDGFGTVKLKAGLGDDVARVKAVREVVGPDVLLRIDANAVWSTAQALDRLRELAPYGLELCEQPTADLRGLEGSPVPIAADELVVTDFEAAVERAQIVVLKPMILGGVDKAYALGRRALAAGRRVLVTSSIDGAIARAACAHLAAALSGRLPRAAALGAADPVVRQQQQPAAGIATGRLLLDDVCEDALAPVSGVVRISSQPGLGL